MSLTDVASSTLSTLINHIIIVVSDGNSSSSMPEINIGDKKSFEDNATNFQSTFLPHLKKIKYVYIEQGVATGNSQEKIIAVMCMLITFSIFGCLGNGLVLYVFTKKSDKVTSTIFILALAWTDFFTCLVIIPITATNIGLNSRLYLDILCKAYEFLITSNVPLSSFIMVAIAVDRYFSICHPFMRVVTPQRARIALFCLVMVAGTLGSITACIYGVWQPTSSNKTQNDTFREFFNNSLQSPTISSEGGDLPILLPTPAELGTITNNRSFEDLNYLVYNHSEGLCTTNELIFSYNFTELYQKIYISFYIIALLAVLTLYFFIYRSVAQRREWRRKQKSFSHTPMAASSAAVAVNNCKANIDQCGRYEQLELAPQSTTLSTCNTSSKENGGGNDNGKSTENTGTSSTPIAVKKCGHENGAETSAHKLSAEKKTIRERRDFNFLANIRTAIMLFVVTLVFIISFLPAWLMATSLISYEIVIFYMHFIYNVANPVIYAFMNQSFRKELKRVFQRGTHLLRGG